MLFRQRLLAFMMLLLVSTLASPIGPAPRSAQEEKVDARLASLPTKVAGIKGANGKEQQHPPPGFYEAIALEEALEMGSKEATEMILRASSSSTHSKSR